MAGNGSYILRLSGLDLHGPTQGKACVKENNRKIKIKSENPMHNTQFQINVSEVIVYECWTVCTLRRFMH